MNQPTTLTSRKQVANWLLLGVFMIMVQVMIGGITRLTESGLSITEWKPITGALPPFTEAQWQEEFAKYRNTDQFKFVHASFEMSDFKFIFFWEWFHRLWARMMGMVFLAGFLYFLLKKKLDASMVKPMILLFILGALQGAIGWIMVKSGLVPEKFYVGHVELTTHFIMALILLSYTLWFALDLMPSMQEKIFNSGTRKILIGIGVLLFFQLMYGGFMAGMKAAITAPTWPDINGSMIPASLNELPTLKENLFYNKITVHFIHRGLAYLLLLLAFVFYFKTQSLRYHQSFERLRGIFILLILLQVILGISTVLWSTYPNALVWLGVSHQMTAMLIVCSWVTLMYIVRNPRGERF
jgi:cytochrome c oxidase assembly protein subunit 15